MTTDFFHYKGFTIPVDLINMTGAGTDTFDVISKWHIDSIQHHIGIRSTDSVVEIGCGIGRDAIPLTEILGTAGTYFGTDVIGTSIDWCVNNITPLFPNFRFEWHDIYDDLHNPNGVIDTLDIILNVPDNSVDLIILQSVFTHMFEHEICHYLKEFRRILKLDGRVWASIFIVTPNILQQIADNAQTVYQLSFNHVYGDGCFINSLDSKRGAVAFTHKTIDRMLRASHMTLAKPILKGSWSGTEQEPESGQDCLILKRI